MKIIRCQIQERMQLALQARATGLITAQSRNVLKSDAQFGSDFTPNYVIYKSHRGAYAAGIAANNVINRIN